MRTSDLVRNWFFVVLTVGVGLALAFPGPLRRGTGWIDPRPTVALALFLMAWGLPSRNLAQEVTQPWAALLATAISYGMLPAAAWLVGSLAPAADFAFGLFLIACVPCTLGSAVLWTRMAGGNEATALLTILLTTSTSWLFTNAWLALATGASAAGEQSLHIMTALLINLVVPVGLGQLCRASPALVQLATRRQQAISVLAQFLILSIVIKAAAEVGERLHAGTARLELGMALWTVAVCGALHLSALIMGLWTIRLCGWDRARQIAVAFAGSQKSLPVALLLFDAYFREEAPLAVVPLLFYHVGQLLVDTPIARWLRTKPLAA